jgi:transposase InsO family protein
MTVPVLEKGLSIGIMSGLMILSWTVPITVIRFRMLTIIDEYTRECLAVKVDRKLNSTDVVDVLLDLFAIHGVPDYIRSDNGSEFTGDELLNGEIFNTLKEAQMLIEQWRKEYNTVRPHSSPGYKPPVPETIALNY